MTIFDSVNEYGMGYRSRKTWDGLLFQTTLPFPGKCEILTGDNTMGQGGHCFNDSTISCEQAKEARLKWAPEEDLEDCIFDVLVADDLGIAEIASQ